MSYVDWASIREEAIKDFSLDILPPTLELPALPHAVTLFMQKSNEPDVTLEELAKIIETDSGLTLELLKYVNSAYVGMRNKVTNIQQTLSLLGQRKAKSYIVTTGMQAAVRSKKSKLINQNQFWSASLQKGFFARELAKMMHVDEEIAFSGALLQDFLLPVLTNDLFEQYLNFIESRKSYQECISAYEQQELGWDHALAGASLAHRWHLPDELVCCILFHHHGLRILAHPKLKRSPVAPVALSALLPDQMRQQYHGLHQLKKLEAKWPVFNLEELAAKVDELHENEGLGLKNDFPLLQRCQKAFEDESAYDDGTLDSKKLRAEAMG